MKFTGTFLILLFVSFSSFATWSIILVDTKTGEIGIAGASCSYNCYGIGRIIPGKGAVIVQAMSNNDARKKGLEMLEANASPDQIIKALRDPEFDPEEQQYAVVSLNYLNDSKTYTGTATHTYHGSLISRGVSVQGNTLTNKDELKIILETVLKGQKAGLRIDDILMLALEAGSIAGGDKRCGEQRATSAFMMVARPTDKPSKLYMELQFFGQKRGGTNAVTLLKGKYEKWKTNHPR
ncbi:DUF1028 domain-containing protein [Larkinella humicola]|uniref:DUF1028 domain-containing protein n=1 Tax=Larkinella humicola TaxID=2607654 RepID=A0A5N1JKX0_9BACT|nr:DUF1028 domain-containing protein [Larkinella humicola]KAA9357120.1 DUF1028 domain-containing protein [Larkinella humicola]